MAELVSAGLKMAALTAIGSVGGFPRPPNVWINMSDNVIVQGLAVWALVTQAGQFQKSNVMMSLLVTVLFMIFIFGVRYLEGSWSPFELSVESGVKAPTAGIKESYYNPRFFAGSAPTKPSGAEKN